MVGTPKVLLEGKRQISTGLEVSGQPQNVGREPVGHLPRGGLCEVHAVGAQPAAVGLGGEIAREVENADVGPRGRG